MNDDTTVSIKQGELKGKRLLNGKLFGGIPYAAPPIGELRFRPPSIAPGWEGTRDATRPGTSAMQQPDSGQGMPHYARATVLTSGTNEDCLYLNVFTPAADDGARPVMVWIHGGGLQGGSGDCWPFFEGSFLPDDVVLVTINYRLNIFGFLYLDDDFAGAFGTGNLGHLDQIAALRWVQENVSRFGGDPDRVTIFGQSAGGWSVAQLLAIPQAMGLFSAAIVQSGGSDTTVSVAQARRTTHAVLDAIGVQPGDWRALAAVPADQLLAQAADKHPGIQRGWGPFITTAGDSVVPLNSTAEIARGSACGVAVIVGSTRDEWSAVRMAFAPGVLPETNFGAAVSGVSAVSVQEHYARRSRSAQAAQAAFESDWLFEVPTANLADALIAGGAAVWRYRFDWPSPVQDGALGAFHFVEVPFVFNVLDDPASLGDAPPRSIATNIHATWVDFAATGKVNGFGGTPWPRYTLAERHVMFIDDQCAVVDDPDARLLPIWREALTQRSWVAPGPLG